MTPHEDMMLTGRAARAMRGACCFGVLALAALALSACAPSPERAAQFAEGKAISEQLRSLRLAGINTAAAMAVKHWPATLHKEGVEPCFGPMKAKAAQIGPRISPSARIEEGCLIDGELLEGAQTLGDGMARDFAAAVGGLAEKGGFVKGARITAGGVRTNAHPAAALEESGPGPDIHHAEKSPVQIGDDLVYVRQARLSVYFQTLPR